MPLRDGVELSELAISNVLETGISVREDLAEIRAGAWTRQSFLVHCLDGAEADRREGWRQYVEALFDLVACEKDDGIGSDLPERSSFVARGRSSLGHEFFGEGDTPQEAVSQALGRQGICVSLNLAGEKARRPRMSRPLTAARLEQIVQMGIDLVQDGHSEGSLVFELLDEIDRLEGRPPRSAVIAAERGWKSKHGLGRPRKAGK